MNTEPTSSIAGWTRRMMGALDAVGHLGRINREGCTDVDLWERTALRLRAAVELLAELEVTALEPLTLAMAPEIEEDWGE